MSKAYPSNLTYAQYEFLSDLIPEAKPGGRKREVDMWSLASLQLKIQNSKFKIEIPTIKIGGLYPKLIKNFYFFLILHFEF
jgi:hypothetical protein